MVERGRSGDDLTMTAVLLVARASGRRRWRGLVVLTLLIGLAGAAVLASAAGASDGDRRSTGSAARAGRPTSSSISNLASARSSSPAFRRDPAGRAFAVLRHDVADVPGHRRAVPVGRGATDDAFGTTCRPGPGARGPGPAPDSARRDRVLSEGLRGEARQGRGRHPHVRLVRPPRRSARRCRQHHQPDGAPEGPTVHLDVVGIVRRATRPRRQQPQRGAASVFLTPALRAAVPRPRSAATSRRCCACRTTDGAGWASPTRCAAAVASSATRCSRWSATGPRPPA